MINRKQTLIILLQFSISICIAETGYPGFDVFTSSSQLGLGGAGYLFSSPISSKVNPAVSDTGKYFSTSIIRYQAGITSQSVGMSLPWNKGMTTFSIRHISYGTFDGYDNNFQSTGTYQSSDTWVQGGYSKQLNTLPLSIGASTQIYSSSLKDSQIKAILLSVGGEFYIHKIQSTFGLSLHNLGKTFRSNNFANGSLSPKTVISTSKKITHLPLTLFFDTVFSKSQQEPEVFIGGNFKLKNDIYIKWGTSTRKISHNTKQDFLRSVFGASGLGFGFSSGSISIHYGTFIFGTGSTIHGLEIGIQL
ncbi:MAG: hypothetical protein HOB40_02715 [Candidatus Marinimicrobia bacterium]|jgi:hypothetical protein|nr:hypothetical protein [Candidatus Neomarinimicrobiota bacterium]MBT3838418.1 hypothetical protein [Candidatus Neomarinimicrobiota bacterium]MBT3998723.1 hypothetical protein [Candidatus Neomarinimicrobiota bacterium]MBT4283302.1 hypothetical protein [Candidatus Neomarinimicrobiota bacterium]MBT4578385.1 hypothetical protein [Candidatus Neomarinimicrobiota bacterium]